MIRRSSLPRRKSFLKRGTKPIPKLNVKRARRQADKYQAYLRSPEWKEKKRLVRERSGSVCEREVRVVHGWLLNIGYVRCTNEASVVNHLNYRRFTKENLSDLEHLCKMHNEEYESARPWRLARRKALALARAGGEMTW